MSTEETILPEERENLRQKLLQLPPETDRQYETKLVEIVMTKGQDKHDKILQDLLEDEDDKVAFAAFCALCEACRRNKNYSKERDFLDRYRDRFQSHPFFCHVDLLYYVDNFSMGRCEKTLTMAKANADNPAFSRNAGIFHIFADLVATAFETAELSGGASAPEEHWLADGLQAVEDAILLERDYAKFYCTKGRLVALQKEKNYAEAADLIKQAVDLEDSHKQDYAIRVNGYLNHLLKIQAKQQNEHMVKELKEEADRVMQDSMSKNLEFIGLFAGIISFTIGSISISSSLAGVSFAGAAGLIIVLMGALLCVFSGFGVVLHGFKDKKWVRSAVVFLLGLAAVTVGLLICFRLALL